MSPETRRRLVLSLAAALLALGAAVGVQSVLVQANVVSGVTEAVGVVVGVALALPLALEVVRPSGAAPTATRSVAAAAAVVGALAVGGGAAGAVLVSSLGSPMPAAVGAAVAYVAGNAARSFVLRDARSEEEVDGMTAPVDPDTEN